MAWVPIAESGIGFDFQPNDAAQMVGSVISNTGPDEAGWALQLFQAASVRITAQSFTGGSATDRFVWGDVGEQMNTAPDPATAWEPTPFTADIETDGVISFFTGESEDDPDFAFLIEVEVADPPDPPATCKELGRVTRVYASAYARDRVHRARLYATERRCLVVNLHGAIPLGRTVQQVTFQTNDVASIVMSDPAIDGREVMVLLTAQWQGPCVIRVTATLDNGERYVQQVRIDVLPQPYYTGDNFVNGPQQVTATATP